MPRIVMQLQVIYIVFAILICGMVPAVAEMEKVVPGDEGDRNIEARVSMDIMAADNAIQLGFMSLADRLYNRVLGDKDVNESRLYEVRLKLITSLISSGHYHKAKEVLSSLAKKTDSRYHLRYSILLLFEGDYSGSLDAISKCRIEELPSREHAWYYLIQGLISEVDEQYVEANKLYSKAKKASKSDAQLMHIEINILRAKVFTGIVDQSYADDLKEKMAVHVGTNIGFTYARGYAAVLHKLGRSADALAVLDEYLQLARIQKSDEKDDLLLLISMIVDKESERRNAVLEELLRVGKNRIIKKVSLHLLASGAETPAQRKELKLLLDELISKTNDPEGAGHALLDELYLLRAQLYLNKEEFNKAEQDAQALIKKFPASNLILDATRMLAYIAWRHDPPQYRTAADYLNRIRLEHKNEVERMQLGVLVADCYFLNKDYDNASDLYGQILEEDIPDEFKGGLLFQQVLSDLRSEKIELARKHLDTSLKSVSMSVVERWEAEWNYIDALERLGRVDDAFNHVRLLLSSESVSVIPRELALRLMVGEARLSIETQKVKDTPELTDRIFVLLERMTSAALNSEQRANIGSNTFLIKARALMALNREKEALEIFKELRKKYPDSDPAIVSLMEEARYLLSSGNTVEAQQRFIALADSYRDNHNAPVALYEASACAELLGLERTYSDAVDILERLISDYPDSNLVFFAQLKQGDLLRKLNEFGAAQSRYEDLLLRYPDRTDRFQAEMALAYCFLEQASREPLRLEDAVASLERLYDLSNLPNELRIEAGFQWAQALEMKQDFSRAEEVYWQVISQFLIDPSGASRLGVNGRYWIARSIFELGALMERDGRVIDALEVYNLIIKYKLPGIVTAELRRKKYLGQSNGVAPDINAP